MGVVVRRYIDILTIFFATPLVLYSSFFGSSIPTSLFIFKMFFHSLIILDKDNLQTKDEWLVPNLSIVWRFDCIP